MGEKSVSGIPSFLGVLGLGESEKLDITGVINLHAVRMVDEIAPGHCRLVFSETHAISLNGSGADAVVSLIFEHAISSDGKPLSELFATLKSAIQKSALAEDPSPGA